MQMCEYTECHYIGVEGDGLCLYRAASVLLYKTENRCWHIHDLCVNHIADSWHNFRPRYAVGGKCKYKSADHFRTKCLKKTAQGTYEYATDVEIEVLSELLEINIILIGVGPSITPHEGNVYPLGFIGKSTFTNGTLAIRVRNHGSPMAHFEPFWEIPEGYEAKLEAYLIDVYGIPQPAVTPPTPRKGRPTAATPKKTPTSRTPKLSNKPTPTPTKRKNSPSVPQTPAKVPQPAVTPRTPRRGRPTAATPKKTPTSRTPKESNKTTPTPTKRKNSPSVPHTPVKVKKQIDFDFKTEKIPTKSNFLQDPTAVPSVQAFDFVGNNALDLEPNEYYDSDNLHDPDDPDEPEDPDHPDAPKVKVPAKSVVTRKKAWAALPAVSTGFPTLALKKRGNSTSQFYMSAAVHGDEDYTRLKPLRLPPMSIECEYCHALHRPTELWSKKARPCCQHREVTVSDTGLFKMPNDELRRLYQNEHLKSKEFKANILAYNRMFSTVQFKRRTTNQPRKGPYTVQSVNGRVTFEPNSYTDVGDVLAPGQIYFVESDHDTVNFRIATNTEGVTIDPQIVKLIENYLQQNNSFVQSFQTTTELQKAEDMLALADGRKPRELILAINPRPKQRSGYRRAMNNLVDYMLDNEFARPCKDFLAAVFYGSLEDIHYDTFYVPRKSKPGDIFPALKGEEKTIDILTYPLIHLHAEDSWTTTTTKKKEDLSSTMREYYNFRLQVRNEEFNPLFTSGRLLSEYLLNAAVRIEKNKLDYLKQNQVILKASSYKTLRNFIKGEAARLKKNFVDSKFVVLPKTFCNSPRYRQSRFLNGMAMARKFGPPTYFITMTTNPKWPEITEALQVGETWTDRPDIVVRVFRDRRRHLMSDLTDKQLFGQVKAYFSTDEFQKSSLPHVHILLFMVDEDKPKSAEEIDRIISAEIPDKNHPAYDIVVEQMMHHACDKMTGKRKPACYADGKKCRFRFPQQWSDETDIDSRFVTYRRRQDGKRVLCKTTKTWLDNRNSVPTNHYMIARHHCHICVLYSKTTIEAFKYLCIYLNKGGENSYVSITEKNKTSDNPNYEWDEIEHYRECRYLNAAEAVYMIKSHDIGSASHSVLVLPFHEEHEQTIMFLEGEEEGAVLNAKDSALMAYFKYNGEAKKAADNKKPWIKDPRDVLYVDMPLKFTWDKKKKKWHSKVSGLQLGRLGIITPNENNLELFHLRCLLMNVPGATCFQDLRTKDNVVYDTYTEACIAWGLTENNTLGFQILKELVTVMTPRALRYHYCMVIKFCHLYSALALWEMFKNELSEDFAPKTEFPTEIHHNIGLFHIAKIMEQLDMDYTKTDLPKLDEQKYANFIVQGVTTDEVIINVEEFQQDVKSLRPHQKIVFDKIVTKIEDQALQDSNMFMLLGAGGVGKTYLYNTIIKYCKANNISFGACAYTGIAATLLLEGQTAHRLFGIPIKEADGPQYLSSISTRSQSAEHLRDMQVIIWDEISMVHKWQLELVDQFLRKLTGVDKPFAGKIMIFSGSLRQILPVLKNAGRKKIVETCITNSELWQQCEVIELTHNIRAEEDPEFSEWLLKVGDGKANLPGTSRIDLPPDMRVEKLKDLIAQTFPKGAQEATGNEVILTPLNKDMREINDIIADHLPGKKTTYLSYNKFMPDDTWDGVHIPITKDILESTEAANLPPHRLNLKVGSIVMLLCNLDVSRGLCNGSRFRVLECMEYSIKCQRLYGPKELLNEPVYLFKVFISKDDAGLPGVISRQQFPVRLAYCVTINKAQGSTYTRVGLYLPSSCFSHGQLYVALSRAKKRKNVFVHIRKSSEQGYVAIPKPTLWTRNEVYREVLHTVNSHPNYTKLV